VKGLKEFIFCGLVIVTAALSFSCTGQGWAPVQVREDKEYGKVRGAFRHRWWNYYERGLSFAEGQFFPEALSDLEQAIRQRGRDQRRARTYGMHFIDYFPHREVGIISYETGDLNTAKKELELSLSHFPSSKARFYLDLVRKASIEKSGKEVLPPRLTLGLKTDEVWTRDDPVVLSGLAEDEHYVAGIAISGVPVFFEGAQKRIPFQQSLNLPQGRHAIKVMARNLLGKKTRRSVVIHVDRDGPVVALEELHIAPATPFNEVTISGSIYDESGISHLSVNGEPIPGPEGVEFPFTHRLAVDTDSLELVARDQLGNQTSASIPLASSSLSYRPVLLASARSDVAYHLVAGLFSPRDTDPPIIRIKGWADRQTVYLEKVYIEGLVSDESNVETLTVNKSPVLRHKGRHIFFSHMASLEEGENVLTIEARDEAGNGATRTLTIIRCIPKALQFAERLSLTAFPFEQRGQVSEACLAFQDNLIDALVDQNRFRIIERDKLDAILEEQKLSRTKLCDRQTALRLGKIVAAQCIVTGSIVESRTGIEAVARLIDTETSEILSTQDVYDEVKDIAALRGLAEGMAVKFHRDFPLVDGLVVERKGEYIFTDLGHDAIKLQRRLIVYREEEMKHPMTGKMVGSDNVILGGARVTQVMPEMSKAELWGPKMDGVMPLDRVISE